MGSEKTGSEKTASNSPENLRPLEEVYNLDYDVEEYLATHDVRDENNKRITTQKDFGQFLKEKHYIKPKESCSTCHY